jgi:glycosyltransferase involved in cell wall biosynthesis
MEHFATPHRSDDQPAISVVIPCRNEKGHIESCVRSMLAQQPPGEGFEIIVADGMSDDGTRDILERLSGEDNRLRLVDNPEQITPCGMNAGILAARGRYVAIAGAHNRYAPDYLRQSLAVLEETAADNVGGAVICEAHTPVQQAVAAAHHSLFGGGGARWHNPDYDGPADTVFGGVYRREVFERIGLFDRELVRNQDDEFNLRLTRAHGIIWQSRRIRSWYSPRKTLRSLFNQYFQYGYWKVRVIQKHKIPASIRHVVPALFVVGLVLLPPAAGVWPAAGVAWLALVTAYALCSAVAAVKVGRRWGWKVLLLMPIVFACYHFGYGIGFLAGVSDFLIMPRRARAFARKTTRTT